MALSGHVARAAECPLLGVKRTSHGHAAMSAFDPKRTSELRWRSPLQRARASTPMMVRLRVFDLDQIRGRRGRTILNRLAFCEPGAGACPTV